MKTVKRLLSVLLIAAAAVQICGCSTLLNSLAISKIESFVDSAMLEFVESGATADLRDYCEKNYNFSDLLQEQRELFRYQFKDAAYSLKRTRVDDDRNSGSCTVVFTGIPNASEMKLKVGSVKDYKDSLDKVSKRSVEIKFNVKRDEFGDWVFADLDEFYNTFLTPFVGPCYLDDSGDPVNITPEYAESFVLESVWYDPEYGNPLKVSELFSPKTLINVLYFTEPVTVDLRATLYKDDIEVKTLDISVKNDIIATVDFYRGGGDNERAYEPGSYHVEFTMNGERIAKSDPLAVR